MRTGAGSGLLISMLEKLNWFCLTSLIILVLLILKLMGLLLRKNHLLRWLSWLSLPNWVGPLTLSLLLKLLQRNMETWFVLWSFFLLRLLGSFKPTIRPCMEYCCHVWVGVSGCYLQLLDKLQKRICRTVGPSLAASLEPLGHRRNAASLSLFYKYYFGICSYELAQLVPLPYSRERERERDLLAILIDCMIFLSPFLDVTKMFMSTDSFFAQLDFGILYL